MKAGVYDKWLHTIGGGEKVATSIAEALAGLREYRVDLIGSVEVDRNMLEKRMNVNLDQVNLVTWDIRSGKLLSQKTADYDLFVNVSYLDHQPSLAKRSIYYVHFPTPIKRTVFGFIKYETILPFLRRFLIFPQATRGLREIETVVVRAGKWLNKRNRLVFANLSRQTIIVFRIYAQRFKLSHINQITFSSPHCKLEVIDRFADQHNNILNYKLKLDNVQQEDTIIDFEVKKKAEQDGLALVSLTVHDPRFFLFNALKRFLPRYEMALYGSSTYRPAPGLDTYDLFLANSCFSQKWTKEYWQKESLVLNPPVDVNDFKPGQKKNIILNVGRFFVGGHSKRQDVLIEAFKKMVNRKILSKDWELHLVGGIADGKEHDLYVNHLKQIAKGLPVYFHFSASFKELKKLYSQAKFYWHATGFGQNPKKEPICFEHFGISTVEAMAAGAVPVVFDGGGQSEIITDGENGFLWDNVNQLVKKTRQVISDSNLAKKILKSAIASSKKYSKDKFVEKFNEYLKKI